MGEAVNLATVIVSLMSAVGGAIASAVAIYIGVRIELAALKAKVEHMEGDISRISDWVIQQH